MCFHTKVTPSFNTFLYSRNGLQDPQCSLSFFSFYLASIYKLCRTTKEPCSRILCFAQDIYCKRVLNIDRKKKIQQLIVKEIPPLPLWSPAALQQLKVSKTSTGVLPLPCMSSAQQGWEPSPSTDSHFRPSQGNKGSTCLFHRKSGAFPTSAHS